MACSGVGTRILTRKKIMSGPALSPVASLTPVSPAKGTDSPRADTPDAKPADSDSPAGFASELKRQMRGETSKDPDSDTTRDDAEAASPPLDPAATLAVLPTDLGPLVASVARNAASLPTGNTSLDTPRPFPKDGLDAFARAPAAALSMPPASAGTDLPATSDTPAFPADFAATLKEIAAAAPQGAANGREATPIAPDATNNFATLHAAALAGMRGETTPAPAAPLPLHLGTPAQSPEWPQEVGNRVVWMVNHDESHAELSLTPPQLGKIEVSITVSGDQTTAQFVTASPAARELIEHALPRLREILDQSGITLGQADVGTSGQSGGSGDDRGGRRSFSGPQLDEGRPMPANAAPWQRRGEGLVDTFA